jgi:hypothetical protein
LSGCGSVDLGELALRFRDGDRVGVRDELAELAADAGGDAHVYQLNLGLAELALGDPAAAIAALRAARDGLDRSKAAGFADWVAASLADDRALPYEGWDYEHVLVRVMLALADLVSDGGDAQAYLLQMVQKQVDIIESFTDPDGDHPKRGYKLAAIGNYLRAMVAAEQPLQDDLVERELQHVIASEPQFEAAAAELARYRQHGHSRPGHGVLHVVALVGIGPHFVARDEPVSSSLLAVAQTIYNAHRRRVHIPANAIVQVQVPALCLHAGNPTAVRVAVDGVERARTATVTDVEAAARAEAEATAGARLLRAVVRRIFKVAVIELGKEAATEAVQRDEGRAERPKDDRRLIGRAGQPGAPEARRPPGAARASDRQNERDAQVVSLLGDVLQLLWTAFEAADTRCWALLPATIQVARVELPAGDYVVSCTAIGHGALASPQEVGVRVSPGRNAFVVVQAPGGAEGPPPLTSSPSSEPTAATRASNGSARRRHVSAR